MANKNVEEMVKEVDAKNSFYTRDHNGFCGMHIDRTMLSSKKTAIVYQTAGSNWNRGGALGGGISYFQGTGVYNGNVDLVVKPHRQWRSGSNYHDDCPGNCYQIRSFSDMSSGLYELVLSNQYGEEKFEVDFEKKKVSHKN
jgi:hypothetical protein